VLKNNLSAYTHRYIMFL